MTELNYAPPISDLETPTPIFEAPVEIVKKIRTAAIAGCVSAGFTLLMVLFSIFVTPVLQLGWESIFDVALITGLAFGIYKKSRTCAVIMFVYFIYAKIYIFITNPTAGISGLVMGVLFAYFYFMGILGTFKYHKLKKTFLASQPA